MTSGDQAISFQLTDVFVRFGSIRALDGVTLEIGRGEKVALVGPSGSGKTTLLRLLGAAVRPGSGTIAINEKHPASASSATLRSLRADIGFVHQNLNLVANLRVLHNVLLGRVGRTSVGRLVRQLLFPSRGELLAVYELLQRLGIEDKLYERTDRLSGGQQQRVAIARALFQQPKALLADEPVSSVDPARARDTVKLFCELSEERGLTLCMSLHNLDLAREYFPRLIGMRNGRIIFDSPTAQVDEDQLRSLYDLGEDELREHL